MNEFGFKKGFLQTGDALVDVINGMKILFSFLLVWCVFMCVKAESFNKIHIEYPLDLHYTDGSGHLVSLSSTRDKLTCFGNRDYAVVSVMEALGCISLSFLPFASSMINDMACMSLWGSRSLSVESNSSVEFYRSTQYEALRDTGESVSMRVQRWLHVEERVPELRQIPAEPFYLCARANDWRAEAGAAEFSVLFRSGYIRKSDRGDCIMKVMLHCVLVAAMSSMWLLPYVVALFSGTVAYNEGLRFDIVLTILCFLILLLFPLMLQQKNLLNARLYLKYFFTRVQAEEARILIRQKLPLFQATFFSSALVCMGALVAHVTYSQCGIDRETRNSIIRVTMALSAGWFVFFLCRSFERFCHDWFWVVMSITLNNQLEQHLNPSSRDKVLLASLLVSFIVALFPRLTGYRSIWRNMKGGEDTDGYIEAGSVGERIPFVKLQRRGSGTSKRGGNDHGDDHDEILSVVSGGLSDAVDSVFLTDDDEYNSGGKTNKK